MSAKVPSVCWDRTETQIIGVFPAKSLPWLNRQFTFLGAVLTARVDGYAAELAKDPVTAALGMPAPTRRPNYPPLRVALDQWFPADMPEESRAWWEPDVLGIWLRSLPIVRTTLPADGNVVEMSHSQAHAWTMVLPPLHCVYAVLRGGWPLPPDTTPRAVRRMGPDYRPVASRRDTVLAALLEQTQLDLVATLGHGGPIR